MFKQMRLRFGRKECPGGQGFPRAGRTLTPSAPPSRLAEGRGLTAAPAPETALRDPGVAGDVTPAGPIGLPAALSLRVARIRLSPARGGRGAWACAAARRPPPRGTTPLSQAGAPLAWASGKTGAAPHTPRPGLEACCGGGGGAGASRRLVAAPAPPPLAAAQPRGSC